MASIWARYSPMIRIRAPGCLSRSSPRRVIFSGFSAAMRNCARLSAKAYSIRARTHRHAFLDAGGARNPCLPFQVFPGNIEAFGPDESEDVCLASVLSNEGRRETQ